MVKLTEVIIEPQHIQDNAYIHQAIEKKLALRPHELKGFYVKKRSIDARKKPVYVLRVEVFINEEMPPRPLFDPGYQCVSEAPPVHIIGFGPAGMFAALECLRKGLKPIIYERGKSIRERRRDLAILTRQGIVNKNSNYCFGEGGAGTFSDGKLYTRSTKRGNVYEVLQLLHYHGAPESILIDSHPHIGTNYLPKIIENIRNTILRYGGEIYFQHLLTDIWIEDHQIKAICLNHQKWQEVSHLILATGHSANDIYELLYRKNILLESKEYSIGVRIEMPQSIIDSIQYHCATRNENLPPASYSLSYQSNEGRGVYSFCMCPGGIIAPCATSPGEIVTNGWSPSRRNNPFANAGIVVTVGPKDFSVFGNHPLAGLWYRSAIERKSFKMAGNHLADLSGQVAPAQRAIDFLKEKLSATLPPTSYIPGIRSVMLDELLPSEIHQNLAAALKYFGKKMKGYINDHTLLVAPETRTSSPVRIPRNKTTYQHPHVQRLYPAGEGAGYAGGIVSAAMDGMNIIRVIASCANGNTPR